MSLLSVSTCVCFWRPIFCSCVFGLLQSLSLCLCILSDSGLLGYDSGSRSVSIGLPFLSIYLASATSSRYCLSPPAQPSPHARPSDSPTGPALSPVSRRPAPAPSGVSAALCRPLSALVFPPPLSTGRPLDLSLSLRAGVAGAVGQLRSPARVARHSDN